MKIDKSKLSNNAADNSFLSLMGASGKGILEIPIDDLVESEQPFSVVDDERMETLVQDIKINGVLEPILVLPMENGKYRILAGHRRTHASKRAGLHTVPCIFKDVGNAQSNLILTNTNLTQREKLLPSKLAYAYKLQQESYKELGVAAHSVRTTAEIAKENNISVRMIQYYLKLAELYKPLLNIVDREIIGVKAAGALTALSEGEQKVLADYINHMDEKQLQQWKKYNSAFIVKILTELQPITKEKLDAAFFPIKNAKPAEPVYDSYIVNRSDFTEITDHLSYLKLAKKLQKGFVLDRKKYKKLKFAQDKILKQMEIIEKIIDDSNS